MEVKLTSLKKWLILLNIALGVFMATLDITVVNITLPIISNHLKVGISSSQWISTSYLLTISVLLLICGKLSDMFSSKKMFALGFITFTIGSALCGLSSNLKMLGFFRVLQAVGASAMMALSQGIVTSFFSSSERGLT
jgi:MFS family permease